MQPCFVQNVFLIFWVKLRNPQLVYIWFMIYRHHCIFSGGRQGIFLVQTPARKKWRAISRSSRVIFLLYALALWLALTFIKYISSLHSADESPLMQQGRNSCSLLWSCFSSSCHVWCLKTSFMSISLAVYCLYIFFLSDQIFCQILYAVRYRQCLSYEVSSSFSFLIFFSARFSYEPRTTDKRSSRALPLKALSVSGSDWTCSPWIGLSSSAVTNMTIKRGLTSWS